MSTMYNIGDYVQLPKKRRGHIRFEGRVVGVGDCFGVELDAKDAAGHDGSMNGKKYFEVPPGFGMFIKKSLVKSRVVSLAKKLATTKSKSSKIRSSRSPTPISTTTTATSTSNTNDLSPKKSRKNKSKSPSASTASKNAKANRKNTSSTSTANANAEALKVMKRSRSVDRDNPNATKSPILRRSSTPRPRVMSTARSKSPRPNTPSSTSTSTPTAYPAQGSHKEKLTFIFRQLNANTTSSAADNTSTSAHRRSSSSMASEVSKHKIGYLRHAIAIMHELEHRAQDAQDVDNLVTPTFIVKGFRSVFESGCKDKKFVVQQEMLRLLHALVSSSWTQHSMCYEQSLFVMKVLLQMLLANSNKTVAASQVAMKALLYEALLYDDSKLVKMLLHELLRQCKTSTQKIVRKYCWLYIVYVLETKYATGKVKPDHQKSAVNTANGNTENGNAETVPPKILTAADEKEDEKKEGNITTSAVHEEEDGDALDIGIGDSDDDEPPEPMEVNIDEIVKQNPLPHINTNTPSPVVVNVVAAAAGGAANALANARVMKKKAKPPKSILDVIAKGLPQGLNENDREIQLQAMRVLSLFSLLDETRADRFLSKLSVSSKKLFDAKYGHIYGGVDKVDKKKKNVQQKKPKIHHNNGVNHRVHVDSPRPTSQKRNSLKKLFSLKEDSKHAHAKETTKLRAKSDRLLVVRSAKTATTRKNQKNLNTTKNVRARSKSPRAVGAAKNAANAKTKLSKSKSKSPVRNGTKNKKTPPQKPKTVSSQKTLKTGDTNTAKKSTGIKKKIPPSLKTSSSADDIDEDDQKFEKLVDGADDAEPSTEAAEPTSTSYASTKSQQAESNAEVAAGEVGAVVGAAAAATGRPSDRRRRNNNTFDGANGVGNFDTAALQNLTADSISDEDDDDDDEDAEDSVDKTMTKIRAGMKGDARHDGDDDDDAYSSSTETYEGDNDIEIYEFPRKSALDKDSSKDTRPFTIDIDSYLANSNAEYHWNFGNEEMLFFSQKNNTHLLMSRISRLQNAKSGDYDDDEMRWMEKVVQHRVDLDDLSLIRDTCEFWPTDVDANYTQYIKQQLLLTGGGSRQKSGETDDGDTDETLDASTPKHARHEYIAATHISYNLMRLLTNEHGSEWIKQFIEECIYEIMVHALCVFHPLSTGNVYHARVILEILLNHFPAAFFKFLVEDTKVVQPLLRTAVFNNIHHGNLNSFVMDLICFDPECIQLRDDLMYHEKTKLVQQCMRYKTTLLRDVFARQWAFVPNILSRACSQFSDDISTKYAVFFVDLVARCASIETTKCLFEGHANRVIETFIHGLLGQGAVGEQLNFWQRIRCGQSLVEYLDLASRPSIIDPSMAVSPFAYLQTQNAYKENIFYGTFKQCLSRLIEFVPALCRLIVDEDEEASVASPMASQREIRFSYGPIKKPLGRLKLNAMELLTVTIDFHEMQCAVVLEAIPMTFWDKIVDLALRHHNNNMFLCHFRRLVHLGMIFRRRILRRLCEQAQLVEKMVDFFETHTQRTELHGYVLQMLHDIYQHDTVPH